MSYGYWVRLHNSGILKTRFNIRFFNILRITAAFEHNIRLRNYFSLTIHSSIASVSFSEIVQLKNLGFPPAVRVRVKVIDNYLEKNEVKTT